MTQLLAINPRRARNKKGRFVKVAHARKRAQNPKRRHKRRANPVASKRRRRRNPIAAIAAVNPRRRRKRNPVRHYKVRSRRRNPISLGGFSPKGIIGQLIPAAIGGAGALALDVALAYIPQPAALQSTPAKMVVRILGAIGLGMVAGKVLGKEKGKLVTLGGLTVAAYAVIRDAAKQALPTLPGLSDYEDYSMGYMNPAPQLEAYMGPGTPAPGMAAYMGPQAADSAMGNYGDGM